MTETKTIQYAQHAWNNRNDMDIWCNAEMGHLMANYILDVHSARYKKWRIMKNRAKWKIYSWIVSIFPERFEIWFIQWCGKMIFLYEINKEIYEISFSSYLDLRIETLQKFSFNWNISRTNRDIIYFMMEKN